MNTDLLLSSIDKVTNPLIMADRISVFIATGLRSSELTLYEGYCLNAEKLRLSRLGYTQPAWCCKVMISNCLEIFNQLMLARLYSDENGCNRYSEWISEAIKLKADSRSHYFINNFSLSSIDDRRFLAMMSNVRKKYDSLSDDAGPYHVEYFPAQYYSPEDALLNGVKLIEAVISKDVEDIIIAVNIKW